MFRERRDHVTAARRRSGRIGSDVLGDLCDAAEAAVPAGVVESEADGEDVGDVEGHVLDFDFACVGDGFAEKDTALDAGCAGPFDHTGQPGQCESGVEDVVDKQNSAAGQLCAMSLVFRTVPEDLVELP